MRQLWSPSDLAWFQAESFGACCACPRFMRDLFETDLTVAAAVGAMYSPSGANDTNPASRTMYYTTTVLGF